MAKDLVVIATPPGGTITQIGSDSARGVWVEGASWEHSLVDHGGLRAQFTLRRRPEQEWPDLQPFTPIVIMKSGSVAWSGRVQETPTVRGMENLITVQCEGWPMHLKDDALQKLFVMNDLTAWADARTKGVSLASWRPNAYEVDVGSGAIRIGVSTVTAIDTLGGVVYDAGPLSTVASIVVTYVGGGVAGLDLRVAGGDTVGALTEINTIDPTPIATGSTSVAFVFTTPRRFVHVHARSTGAVAAGDTAWVSLSNIILFGSDSYRGGFASFLLASQIATAVLPYAPKVSQSTTGISTTAFSIPHFTGPATAPADYIDAANAYHLYQWFLKDDAAGGPPSLVYRAIPTSPTLIASVGNGIVFEDASRNDGGDIYNRVLVDYTDAAGNAALEERIAGSLPAAIADPDIVFDTPSSLGWTNADFETAGGPPATGWTQPGGSITRDTTQFDSGVASAIVNGAAPDLRTTSTVSLVPGRTYTLQMRIRKLATWAGGVVTAGMYFLVSGVPTIRLTSASGGGLGIATADFTVGVWTTVSVTFTATTSVATQFTFGGTGTAADMFNVDNIKLYEARPTIIDRQGFIRTRVLATSSRLTAAAADQIGDVFLQAHRFTPLRGTLTVQGAALRTLQGDVPIPAHLLARRLGDAVLINETDPDFGVIGRVGNISNIAYDEPSDSAVIAIDNRKDFIDALLARLAVFTGSS